MFPLNPLEAAIGMEQVAVSPPYDMIAEKPRQPDRKRQQILQWQQPPDTGGKRIMQDPSGARPGGTGSHQNGQRGRRPTDHGRRGAASSQPAMTANTAAAPAMRMTSSIGGGIGGDQGRGRGGRTACL